MNSSKVLYISQEISPYLAADTMSTLGRMIPQGIQEKGYEVRTFMPRYGCINERRNQLHEVIRLSGLNIIIDDTDHPLIIKVATLQPTRMQVYFIDNDDYFLRHTNEGLETDISPADNDERCIFFTRGVIETVRKLRWEPAIIHCSGWITALAPLFIKRNFSDDPTFANAKVVYSLYGRSFEGNLDPRFTEKLKSEGFSDDDIAALTAADDADFIKLNRLAIDYADAIVESTSDVDPAIIDYAKASGKPFLPFPGDEDYIDAYNDFYSALIN